MLQADGTVKVWSLEEMRMRFNKAFAGAKFDYDISKDVLHERGKK